MQALGKLFPGRRAEVFAVLHRGAHFLAQGVIIPGSATHPQNGERFREQLLTCQSIERRDQGGTAQIASDPTNHDYTRIRWCAVCHTGAMHLESLLMHPCPSSGPVTVPPLAQSQGLCSYRCFSQAEVASNGWRAGSETPGCR